jgi:alkanesulfonate monooxygenase SsuD/methylene tetrahydromethanopterin reductase-like flavin-dependent oxidoreductase (luciferase family)
MKTAARDRLASEFIEHCTHQLSWGQDMVLRRQSLHPEVLRELDDLAHANPTEYLEVVTEIVRRDQSDDVMLNVSAPLQVLLETEPEKVVEQVEELAARSSEFRNLLSWFMPSDPNDEVWLRILKVAGDVPW